MSTDESFRKMSIAEDERQLISPTDPRGYSGTSEILYTVIVDETNEAPTRRVILPNPTGFLRRCPAHVLWDIEDTQILERLDPDLLKSTIDDYVFKKGGALSGGNSILAYLENSTLSDELRYKYLYAGIQIMLTPKGDELASINKLLVDMLLWARMFRQNPTNMVIVAEDKSFGEGTKFSIVRKALEEAGFFVDVVHLDEVLKSEGARLARCNQE